MAKQFWCDQRSSSAVKAKIVSDYFGAWATVMAKVEKLAYIDLFSGPGIYDDGCKSTPILILEKAIGNEELQKKLITVFNDNDRETVEKLKTAVAVLPGLNQLKHQPVLLGEEVNDDFVNWLKYRKLPPTLLFIDPWGFKGLSRDLIASVLKDFGSDCIFFFNYNEVNRWVAAPNVRGLIDDIFGAEMAEQLRSDLHKLRGCSREDQIIAALEKALNKIRGKYVLRFRFKEEEKNRTSHYLIFVTKGERGYNMMKDIMDKASSSSEDGVASFEYDPTSVDQQVVQYPLLDQLADELLGKFSGRTLSVEAVYDEHKLGTPYILRNYQEALRRLEDRGRITIDPPARMRRKGTLKREATVVFPER